MQPSMTLGICGTYADVVKVSRLLTGISNVRVGGIWTPYPPPELLVDEETLKVPHYDNLADLIREQEITLLLDLSGSINQLPEQESSTAPVIQGLAASVVLALADRVVSLQDEVSDLRAVLDIAPEGISVVDRNGTLIYRNAEHSRLTRRESWLEAGENIRTLAPNGILVQVLRTRQTINGFRMKPKGSDAELVLYGAPIFRGRQMVGAVAFSRDVTEVLRLSNELRKSTEKLEHLYERLSDGTDARYDFHNLVGKSRAIQRTIEVARRAAGSDSTVLLQGESGTGKEVFAHAIHRTGNRRNRPFIRVNCAAIPESLLESEFFGHEKGAFTGAERRRIGLFELADTGTIFLDEIGDMSLVLQAKLLRVLQDGEVLRVGGTKPVKVDVRVIAATNRNLKEMVQEKRFREDLYFRLNVVNIRIPPLRERGEDIPALAEHTIGQLNKRLGKRVKGVTPELMEKLLRYNWPGNIRELENVVERAMIVAEGQLLNPGDVTLEPRADRDERIDGLMPLRAVEQLMVRRALEIYGSTTEGKRCAARALGISLSTLYAKLQNPYDSKGRSVPETSD